MKSNNSGKFSLELSFYLLFAGWLIIILGIIAWSYITIADQTLKLAKREAYKDFEKDLMFRSWAISNKNIYFESAANDHPSAAHSKTKFSLINPAYLTRQVHELSFKQFGITGNITSLKPVEKENAPDMWEILALHKFEMGAKEYSGFEFIKGVKYFRYMGPLVITEDCLQCHSSNKKGDIAGGISYSIPWEDYHQSIIHQSYPMVLGYGILLAIGFIGLFLIRKRLFIYIGRCNTDESEMKILNVKLQNSSDIVEEKLFQNNILIDELTQTKQKLEKINSEKDKFFSIIAHDLKSPFQGFIGGTEMIADNISVLSKGELSLISKQLNNSAKNLYKLLRNILEWAQMQQDTDGYNPVMTVLSESVNHNIGFISNNSKQKGIEILSEISSDIKVYADAAMLDSLLRNLLSNSIKFTKHRGRVILRAYIIENNMVEISVRDSGIGMTDAFSKKLFKMEEKVGRLGTNGEESTGLGLLLCLEYVKKHGGKIWVESRENIGSTFYFTLPLA
jgi:signal transduction histidine kinase